MNYSHYCDLLQPSDQDDEEYFLINFIESLNKKYGYEFNTLINVLNSLAFINYEVSNGFDYKSDNESIRNFEEIHFMLYNDADDIEITTLLESNGLDGIFEIIQNENIYIFKINK